MKVRRTLLFVPSNSSKMVDKAHTLASDMIVLDLEDSVPEAEKLAARSLASGAVKKGQWVAKEVGIRINGLDTGYWREDLEQAVAGGAAFVVVPKVEKPEDIETIEGAIHKTSAESTPEVAVTIESPRGLINMERILAKSHLVTAAIFGAEDYTLSLGLRTLVHSPMSISYARSYVPVVARAFAVDPIAEAFVSINDLDGLRVSAKESKDLGYAGKGIIHPAQIPVVNEVFSPTAEELGWADEVLGAWEKAKQEGKAAFRVRDRMVDSVHIKMAQEIRKTAEQAGAVPPAAHDGN